MVPNRPHWQDTVDKLVVVAKRHRGEMLGERARSQLLKLIVAHPEIQDYKAVSDLAWQDIMLSDYGVGGNALRQRYIL